MAMCNSLLSSHTQVLTSQQFVMAGDEPGAEVEVLHPVCCAACETGVGVRDEDNVYHFFEVIAESPE